MQPKHLKQIWFRRCEVLWSLLKSGKFGTLFSKSLALFRRFLKPKSEINYDDWREKWVAANPDEKNIPTTNTSESRLKPFFVLILNIEKMETSIYESTILSVIKQHYPYWNLKICGNVSSSRISNLLEEINDDRIKVSSNDQYFENCWFIQLIPGELLNEQALFSIAECITKEIKVVYTDNDHINQQGRYVDPHMKPDWNSELLKGMDYFAAITAFHNSVWKGFSSNPEETHKKKIQITDRLDDKEILHLPKVLSSLPTLNNDSHLFPAYRNKTPSIDHPAPLVSILLPTKNKGKLLEKCIASLEKKTNYPNIEIVIIDHESREKKARKIIDQLKLKQNFKVSVYSGIFNFSAMMNKAAEIASGEVLILLNNDTEIIDPKWLDEMVSEVTRQNIGIVGALLLFKDRTIQHAGIHPGVNGLMGHGHKHLHESNTGYFNRLKVPHEVAAVTGACLAIEKTTWNELGGLDAENLPVAYNDVDLCLKARSAGLKVLFTPKAKLIHHESKSRGFDNTSKHLKRLEKEIRVMNERWGDLLYIDPAYSPNLSLENESFTLAEKPRIDIDKGNESNE